MDEEDARLEFCRRFLRWFGPQTVCHVRRWTGVEAKDAAITWGQLRRELVLMELAGESRMLREFDIDRTRSAKPLSGVRLSQNDDPWLKLGRTLHLPDKSLHDWLLPTSSKSRGYAPNAVIVDGTIAGVWQRQQRKVTTHLWRRLSRNVEAAIEHEALSFPIRSKAAPTVSWDER